MRRAWRLAATLALAVVAAAYGAVTGRAGAAAAVRAIVEGDGSPYP